MSISISPEKLEIQKGKMVNINVFEIDELEEIVKEKVVNKLRESNNYIVNDSLNEWFEWKISEKKYPIDDIIYDLSYSQSSFLSFFGSIDKTEELIQRINPEFIEFIAAKRVAMILQEDGNNNTYPSLEDIYITIEKSNYNSMVVEVEIDEEYLEDDEELNSKLKELKEIINEDINELIHKLIKEGYELIEEDEKEENIIECSKENDFLYTEDGIEISNLIQG